MVLLVLLDTLWFLGITRVTWSYFQVFPGSDVILHVMPLFKNKTKIFHCTWEEQGKEQEMVLGDLLSEREAWQSSYRVAYAK